MTDRRDAADLRAALDPGALRAALDGLEDATATRRLMVVVAYAEGVPAADLADWYGVSRKTVYNWVGRAVEGPVPGALRDRERPGRPSRLDADERTAVAADLADPPAVLGYDATAWTPALLRRHLAAEYGVEYSERHARRLLDRLG